MKKFLWGEYDDQGVFQPSNFFVFGTIAVVLGFFVAGCLLS